MNSLASQFLDASVRCNDSWKLDILESIVYFGSLLGYLTLSILSDNIGRKKSLLISLGIAMSGIIITASSFNIYIAGIGLFLTGFGADVSVNICFYFIAETVEDHNRMKHSIIIQIFFSLGGLLCIGYYYFIKTWRLIYWICLVIPIVITYVLIVLYIEETPYFMITKFTGEKVKEKLLKISKINKI